MKTLKKYFAHSQITQFYQLDKLWIIVAEQNQCRVTAIWTNDEILSCSIDSLQVLSASSAPETITIVDLLGDILENNNTLTLSGDVTYFIQQSADK